MEKRMVLKYVLSAIFTGIILLLPAGAVYLLFGWKWAVAVCGSSLVFKHRGDDEERSETN